MIAHISTLSYTASIPSTWLVPKTWELRLFTESLMQEKTHPFVQAMGDFLLESALRANRPSIMNTLMRGSNAKYEADLSTMNELVDTR